MWRSSILQKLLVSSVAVITAGVFSPQILSANPAEAYPKTVQVKPGGAEIYAQPKSGGQVIGEYKPGIILSPKLKVFSNEGQVWLKIGDHWVPEESFTVLEDVTPYAGSGNGGNFSSFSPWTTSFHRIAACC
ncbi:MAG: hypothetical protein HC934_02220 [Acaryochloridaceae cyanobacterium SU_2_1]|nr:hypothetical protein [Acaryochloridaceae cyanobacterium SU_2_1]